MDSNGTKKNEMEQNIELLKGFLSLDFNVDPSLVKEETQNTKQKRINKRKLNKFLTSDDEFDDSGQESDIKEDDEEDKYITFMKANSKAFLHLKIVQENFGNYS